MKHITVSEHGKLKPGVRVIVIEDSGFEHGKRQRKTLELITAIEWTTEECSRLNVPLIEYHYHFTDGSRVGHYAKVYPDPDKN